MASNRLWSSKFFPDLNVSSQDIQIAHRLQNDHTVICKFYKKTLRDKNI